MKTFLMKIEVIRIPKNKEKTDIDLTFVDVDVKEVVGHCNYSVSDKEGLIYDTYFYPDYRNKKIMSTYINNILCDIKCMGADKVMLHTLSDEAYAIWERFGFKQYDKKGNMQIDISDKECKCICNLHRFINEIDTKKLIEQIYKQ